MPPNPEPETSPEDRPLTDLAGHHLEISTRCCCTKVAVFSPEYLVERLGRGATLRTAAARLICRTCRVRPELLVSRDYPTSEGRDRRVNPPPLPGWVAPLLQR
jgi:hypothetical protein